MFFFHITCFMCTDLWGPELESQWEKRGLLPGALAATFTSRQAAAVLLKGPVCLLPAGHTSVCKDLWMTYRLCQYATTACFVFESVLLSGDSHNQEAMLQATTGGSACVCVCVLQLNNESKCYQNRNMAYSNFQNARVAIFDKTKKCVKIPF